MQNSKEQVRQVEHNEESRSEEEHLEYQIEVRKNIHRVMPPSYSTQHVSRLIRAVMNLWRLLALLRTGTLCLIS